MDKIQTQIDFMRTRQKKQDERLEKLEIEIKGKLPRSEMKTFETMATELPSKDEIDKMK